MAQVSVQRVSKGIIITSLLAGLFLLIVNTAVWVNRQIFDEKNFTNTTISSLTSQSSRDAIAGRIVDESLKNYPAVQDAADDSLTKIISGLLDGDRVHTILTKSVSTLHIYLTSNNQQDVVINLAGIKDTIGRLAELSARSENNGRLLNQAQNIPDQLVLIEESDVPDFYKYGILISLVSPIAFLIALILIAIPYVRDRSNYALIMLIQGFTIALVGIFSSLVGPLFRPVVLSSLENPSGRTVVENLYSDFITTFNNQNVILIILGLSMCIGSLVIPFLLSKRAKAR